MLSVIALAITTLVAIAFSIGTIMWIVLRLLGVFHDEGERVWDSDDVQVRIVTRGDHAPLARKTANIASEFFDDIYIVTDLQMEAPPGATVATVPESYESEALDKGRALDWAEKNIECDKEYVLYLDEDTKVTGFDGLPDADIVQFLECPRKTDSWLSVLTDVGRLGWGEEMKGFPLLDYPPYLWGGGFAVRSSVESDVGWNFDSVTEDTVFLWRAMREGHTYELTYQRFQNQSPLSVRELLKQRRRWFSGSLEGMRKLPSLSKIFVAGRMFSAVAPVLTFAVLGLGTLFAVPIWLYLVALVGVFLWSLFGALRYDNPVLYFVASFVLFPLFHTLHATGALYGVLSHPDGFEVTKKK